MEFFLKILSWIFCLTCYNVITHNYGNLEFFHILSCLDKFFEIHSILSWIGYFWNRREFHFTFIMLGSFFSDKWCTRIWCNFRQQFFSICIGYAQTLYIWIKNVMWLSSCYVAANIRWNDFFTCLKYIVKNARRTDFWEMLCVAMILRALWRQFTSRNCHFFKIVLSITLFVGEMLAILCVFFNLK